jgi:hypothetical protein
MKQHTIVVLNTPSYLIKYDFEEIRSKGNFRLICLLGSNYLSTLQSSLRERFDSVCFMDTVISDGVVRMDIEAVPQTLMSELAVAAQDGELSIVSTNSDYVSLAAALRERFDVPGRWPAEVDRFLNKSSAKIAAAKGGVRVPRGRTYLLDELAATNCYEQLSSEFGASIILKPLEAAGCVGVTSVSSFEEFKAWQAEPKVSDRYEVEEFVVGDLYHYDALVADGEVKACWVWRYAHPNLAFMKGMPLGSFALAPLDEMHRRMSVFGESALHALGATSGFVHMEIFHSIQDELIFLEAGPRPPGLVLYKAYKTIFGLNYVQADLLASIRKLSQVAIEPFVYGFWMAWPQISGTVRRFNKPNLQITSEFDEFLKIGEIAITPKSLRQRSCQLEAFGRDYAVVLEEFNALRWADNPLVVE